MTDPAESPVVHILDPDIDAAAVLRRVAQGVEQRRAEGAYGPDPATRGPRSLRPEGPELPLDNNPEDFPGLRESLAALIAEGHLDEPDFVSNTPLVGPLIVAARRAWNWISTKWYVRPILSRQSQVNARTARVISDLAQWHELDARRLYQLERQVAELEERLAHLEARTKS